MSEVNNQFFDLVIVGAGIVGLTLACALRESDLRIAILDAKKPQLSWDNNAYDARVSAITRASENFLRQCGVWENILKHRVGVFDKMTVWDADSFGHIHFDSKNMGETHLGHMIENRVITKALMDVLESSSVALLFDVTLKNLSQDNKQIVLEDAKGNCYKTSLLVGADGANSWVRQHNAMTLKQWDYDHEAIVATVKTAFPHERTAWQRFLPCGPLAFLPLDSPYYCSIVWSTLPKNAKHLMQLSNEEFKEELRRTFQSRLGDIVEVSPRHVFPLKMRHAMHYVKPNIALVGDAAHTLHPLAGQGLNLGLADVKSLATVLQKALQKNKNIGDYGVLREYERSRKGDNVAMISVMEGFKRLFGTDNTGVKYARNIGLSLTDKNPLVKEFLMRKAMGL